MREELVESEGRRGWIRGIVRDLEMAIESQLRKSSTEHCIILLSSRPYPAYQTTKDRSLRRSTKHLFQGCNVVLDTAKVLLWLMV